jgi:hypothetical protein
MAIRSVREHDSLEQIWEELVFTEARLLGDERTREYAPKFADLLTRLEQVRGGQFGAWREEVTAQALVTAADDLLDDFVRSLDITLLALVSQDTSSPRYRRYFSNTPSSIIRLGLESELARVRGWVQSLETEPEATLKELGGKLRTLVEQGELALERRRQAATSRTDHRVRSITSLVDDINAARLSLYGTLTTKAVELGLPSDWGNRFFRRSSHSAKTTTTTPPTTPEDDDD